MKKIKPIIFCLLLTVSMSAIIFSSCSNEDESILVTDISFEKSALSFLIGEEQILTATTMPKNINPKKIEWRSSDVSKATVVNGKVVAISEGTVIITAEINNHTAVCTLNIKDIKDGVRINGVIWATRNVDKIGTFASTPEDAGMFYQWNRKIAYAVIGEAANWDNTAPTGSKWEKANDPSPAGWRVPTLEEINSLQNMDYVLNEWATVNGVVGRKYTDKATNHSIFLPAAGYRHSYYVGFDATYMGSSVDKFGSYGYYWSSTSYQNDCCAINLGFNDRQQGSYYSIAFDKKAGLSIRSVAE
jgi:uncharacterized protein (TIGR02145 family)